MIAVCSCHSAQRLKQVKPAAAKRSAEVAARKAAKAEKQALVSRIQGKRGAIEDAKVRLRLCRCHH